MKKGIAQISIGFVCMILSFFIVLQFKTVKNTTVATYPTQLRVGQTQELLRLEKEKNEALYKQVMEYKDEIYEYQTQANADEMLIKDLRNAEILAGLVSVEGPGIEITLSDGEGANTQNMNENLYIVHQEDILKVMNELRAAGAEALSVNDQRVLATSEVRCVGNVVNINGVKVAAPFVIKAIGDPDQLESGFKMRGGIFDELSPWIKIEIKKVESDMVVPAYVGKIEYKHSKIITNAKANEALGK
ncbi:MAG: DUF881 domain-containing protein [Ruminococcaceae bacterium]|nr:DUF881 domain-containing protein [Oscillospiraceae bacterium]